MWFKQVLYEIDSVREIFKGVRGLNAIAEDENAEITGRGLKSNMDLLEGPKYGVVDENKMLEIMNRMNRVVMILKV